MFKNLRDLAGSVELFHSCEIIDLESKRVWGALSLRLGRSVFRSGFRFHFLGFWVCSLLFTSPFIYSTHRSSHGCRYPTISPFIYSTHRSSHGCRAPKTTGAGIPKGRPPRRLLKYFIILHHTHAPRGKHIVDSIAAQEAMAS